MSETEGAWPRAWHDTRATYSRGSVKVAVLVIDAAVAVAAEEVTASANKPSILIAVLTLAAVFGASVAVGLAILLTQFAPTPVKQRDEARQSVANERTQAADALTRERQRFDEMDRSHREAFQTKWDETEKLRGLLGASENLVRDLESDLVTARQRIAAFDPGATPRFSAAIERTGHMAFRVRVVNDGPREIFGPTLNLLFPAEWRIAEMLGDGRPAAERWQRGPSDESLVSNGAEIKTALYALRDERDYEVGIAHVFYFYAQGVRPGTHLLSLRIPRYMEALTVEIELVPR